MFFRINVILKVHKILKITYYHASFSNEELLNKAPLYKMKSYLHVGNLQKILRMNRDSIPNTKLTWSPDGKIW